MKRRVSGTLWAGVFVFIASAAWAQMGGGPESKEMMGGGMMRDGMEMHGMMGTHGMGMEMDGGMMDMMKMMKILADLDLTSDQKKKLQSLKLNHQKEAIPLFSRIRMADVEIQESLMTDPVDMEKVKAKVKEKHDAMVNLDVSHLTLMQQVKTVLTPEQRQRMESMMMEMGPMMGAPFGRDGKMPQEAPGGPVKPSSKSTDPHGH